MIKKENNYFIISFKYNPELVSLLKKTSNRKWVPDEKVWKVKPQILKDIDILLEFAEKNNEPDNVKGMLLKLKTEMETRQRLSTAAKSSIDVPRPEGRDYYPFQKAGVEFLELTKGRAVIGDEMGLGKTIQVLGWLNLHPELRPVLVISPSTLKYNWESEINTWILERKKTQVIKSGKDTISSEVDFVIISYDLVKKLIKKT